MSDHFNCHIIHNALQYYSISGVDVCFVVNKVDSN